ncbi:hypothetical protein [Rufibacter soli]
MITFSIDKRKKPKGRLLNKDFSEQTITNNCKIVARIRPIVGVFEEKDLIEARANLERKALREIMYGCKKALCAFKLMF